MTRSALIEHLQQVAKKDSGEDQQMQGLVGKPIEKLSPAGKTEQFVTDLAGVLGKAINRVAGGECQLRRASRGFRL